MCAHGGVLVLWMIYATYNMGISYMARWLTMYGNVFFAAFVALLSWTRGLPFRHRRLVWTLAYPPAVGVCYILFFSSSIIHMDGIMVADGGGGGRRVVDFRTTPAYRFTELFVHLLPSIELWFAGAAFRREAARSFSSGPSRAHNIRTSIASFLFFCGAVPIVQFALFDPTVTYNVSAAAVLSGFLIYVAAGIPCTIVQLWILCIDNTR